MKGERFQNLSRDANTLGVSFGASLGSIPDPLHARTRELVSPDRDVSLAGWFVVSKQQIFIFAFVVLVSCC